MQNAVQGGGEGHAESVVRLPNTAIFIIKDGE